MTSGGSTAGGAVDAGGAVNAPISDGSGWRIFPVTGSMKTTRPFAGAAGPSRA